MSVYGICTIQITDRDEFDRYQHGFMKIFEQFEGELLVVDEAPIVKEGEWPYSRTVVARFPNREALNLWYHSDAYQALVQHRFKAATGNFVVVAGLAPE
ncbi:MAG: DUF1330 domain-containing protein [Myxococcota bacterium]